ncbi:sulfotransferase family protein [Salinibacter ruber]|nr:sulfotransferase [Salinibacter ruber]
MLDPATRTPPSLPDFIIGGAMKSATSSLHHLLSNHEQVYLPDGETHFFCMDDPVQHSGFFFPARAPSQRAPDYDRHGETNLDWYRQIFEPAHPDQCVGDYSSTYLPAPDAPLRIKRLLPDVKLLFMLRNPVDRTYSHYWHRVKTGRAVHGFEYELQHGPSTLLLRSFYKPQLERYVDFFPEDQVKVILFERFVDHTQAVVDEVCSFLGLETAVDVAGVDAHQNRSPVPRWPGLQLLFNYCTTGVETRSEGQLPYPAKPQSSYALQGLVHHLRQLNLTPRRPPPMNDSVRACLEQIFARKNQDLGTLLGVDLTSYWPFLRKQHDEPAETAA